MFYHVLVCLGELKWTQVNNTSSTADFLVSCLTLNKFPRGWSTVTFTSSDSGRESRLGIEMMFFFYYIGIKFELWDSQCNLTVTSRYFRTLDKPGYRTWRYFYWVSASSICAVFYQNLSAYPAYLTAMQVIFILLSSSMSLWVYWASYICISISLCWCTVPSLNNSIKIY